jgi:hypothetical protein
MGKQMEEQRRNESEHEEVIRDLSILRVPSYSYRLFFPSILCALPVLVLVLVAIAN